QNCLNQLADGYAAAGKLSRVGRCGPDFMDRINHRGAETYVTNDGHVGQIIADIANLLGRQAAVANDLKDRRQLVLESLADDVDSQLDGPQLHDVRRARRHHAEAKSSSLPEFDPQAVVNVKALQFDALVVIPNRAIGEHAVDVRQDQFHTAAKVA